MTHTVVMSEKFEEALFALSLDIFTAMLRRDSVCESLWKTRVARLKTHGLLTFVSESSFKPKEITVESERLDDPRYRRLLIRQLKAPRPSKWVQNEIHIDRTRLATDEDYLDKMAKLVAYKWTKKLLPVDSAVTALLLLKQDLTSVGACLDSMGNHQSDAESVGEHKMRAMVEEELDKNETFNLLCAEIRATGKAAREKFSAEMAEFKSKLLADFAANTEANMAKARALCDEHENAIRERIAATAERSKEVLEASACRDPEIEWREQLAEADRKHRENRPKMGILAKSLIGLAVVAVAGVLAFHLEVAGVTPVEALSKLIG